MRQHKTQWLIALVLGLTLATTGCEDSTVTVVNQQDNNQSQNQPENQNQNQEPGNQNQGDPAHQHPHDDEYHVDHGPDDDEVLTDAGYLQGSWRAARAEDDMPLAYFDIFHDDGATSASGDFMMGQAMGELLMGTTGSLSDVAAGSQIIVAWNPTTDDEEMYWVTLTQDNDDLFTGTFEASRHPATFAVTVERRDVDDAVDMDPFEH